MILKGILSISGKPGLFKLISQTKGGLIVESLDDKKRIPVYSAHQISALEEISIYSYSGEVALLDVFKKMFQLLDGGSAMSAKSSKNDMMTFFERVLPDYDVDKVYHSDVKKMFQWYNSLLQHNILVFDEAPEAGNTDEQIEKA